MIEDHIIPDTTPEETMLRVSDKMRQKSRKAVEKEFSKLEKLSVEYVGIDDVRPNSYNPNRQKDEHFELLLTSMEEDGFTQPLLVNKDGVIVDGEHRWLAAHTLGYDEVPIVRVDMDEVQMRVSTIRHNRARGSHDIDREAEIFRDFKLLGQLDVIADSLRMGDDEITSLISDLKATDMLAGDEFSEAWVPGSMHEKEAMLITEDLLDTKGIIVEDTHKNPILKAMTQDAIDFHKKQAEKLEAAETEDERKQLRTQVRRTRYRVNLIFSGDEAEMVRDVLGDEPAEALLDLCIKDLGDQVPTVIAEYMARHKWEDYEEYTEYFEQVIETERFGVPDLDELGEKELRYAK